MPGPTKVVTVSDWRRRWPSATARTFASRAEAERFGRAMLAAVFHAVAA